MNKNRRTQKFTIVLIGVFVSLFLLLSGRFIYIQATGEVQEVSLNKWAEHVRGTSVVLPSERGKIFDTNGNVLAFNRPVYRVYAILNEEVSKDLEEPQHVVDPDFTATQLAPLLDMEKEEMMDILQNGINKGLFQVEFKSKGKNLSEKTKEEIEQLQLPGIHFFQESIRYYPNNMFASHVIGFASEGKDDEEIIGVTGIENMKNKYLTGEDGYINYQKDNYNKKLLNKEEVVKEAMDGDDIYLTIDQKIQSLLEDVLSQAYEKYNPERISAVVMNPKTGEILAMSNRPSLNLNNPEKVENWYNDVISTPVEPGSTMKIFTWAAAIDAGVYNGNELFQSGKYKIHEQVEPVNDHNQGAGWGKISFDEGFRRSSNVAASKLVWEKMDTEVYLDYLHKFGFAEKTGIDLPNEVHGQLTYNYPSDKLRTAFGQGSTVTAIQQMKAATAIINGGDMLKPFVVKKIVDSKTGEVIEANEREVVSKPISEQTADQMIDLMDSVVNSKDGTGRRFQLNDYSVIGKTGTAQIPNPEGGGYLTGDNNYIYSFLGMAPKDNPELMMHVSIKLPELEQNEPGSAPVSFIFNNVMENGLHYLNIEPDKEGSVEEVELLQFPDIIGKDVEIVKKELEDLQQVSFIGNGAKVKKVNVEKNSTIFPQQRIIVITDKVTMPDVIGWSYRDVLTLAELLNIDVETKGSGFVTKQSVKKGAEIKEGMKVSITLSTDNNRDD